MGGLMLVLMRALQAIHGVEHLHGAQDVYFFKTFLIKIVVLGYTIVCCHFQWLWNLITNIILNQIKHFHCKSVLDVALTSGCSSKSPSLGDSDLWIELCNNYIITLYAVFVSQLHH